MSQREPTTSMSTPAPWAIAPRSYVANVLLAVLVVMPIAVNRVFASSSHGIGDIVASLVAVALLCTRHRWPFPTLAMGLAAMVAATAVLEHPTALMPLLVVLLFDIAVRYERRTAIIAGVAGLAALLACIAILVSNHIFGPELLAGLAWPTLAVAAGDVVRGRRATIAAAEERARRAEESREDEARRRVIEERLRIARELHDVVAHRMAVVNVQAGVAAHLLRSKPDEAEQALATVRSSARQVLDELSGILSILRSDDEAGAPFDPAPSIGDLLELIDSFAAAGLSVTFQTNPLIPSVSDAAELAIYRTVQEALTNAQKHGTGSASVRLDATTSSVEVTVDNPTRGVVDGGGFGLIGMRERVSAVGGQLHVGPTPPSTFRVRATFPTLEDPA
jgi:signal transduction histidine kinase